MTVILNREEHFPGRREENGLFSVRRGILSERTFMPLSAHSHEEVELIAVLDGQLSLRAEGCPIALSAGEGILINSTRVHTLSPPSAGECELILVLLHPSLLCVNEAFAGEFLRPLLEDQEVPFLRLRTDRFQHREIYEKIKWIHRMERERFAPLWIQAAFAEIWANFCENHERRPLSTREKKSAGAIRSMMAYIAEHYTASVGLADIAGAGHVGQSTCCKLFAAYTGTSPIEYLTRYRLEQGAALLAGTSLSVQEIARDCGFGGGSYFSEVFHARYGLSPLAFRREHSSVT